MNPSVTFEKIVPEGKGMGYWEGKALFAPGPLPGEVARVRVIRDRPTWAEGVVETFEKMSKERGEASEAHFLQCSPWQGVDYAYQLQLKQHMLEAALGRPELGLEVAPVVGAPEPLGYRNKLEFVLTPELELALHARGLADATVKTLEGCALGTPAMNAAAMAVADRLRALELGGWATSLVVRQSQTTGMVLVVVMGSARRRADWQRLVVPGVAGVVVAARGPKGSMERVWDNGVTTVPETVGGLKLEYPWDAFCQVNLPAFELALERLMALVPRGQRVLDLYGGVGTIGLPAAARGAGSVLGVEVTASAVEQAKANAALNNLANYKSRLMASEDLNPVWLEGADTVIVDPPRAGLDRRLVELLVSSGPRQILYLSCNPVTQARDIMVLQEAYSPSAVTGFDFYPGTLHVESLVTLTRR